MPALLLGALSWLLASLSWLFRSQIGQWLLSLLAFLGLKFFVTDSAVDQLMAYVSNSISGLPATVSAWVGFFNFDRYLSCVVSAYGVVLAKRLTLRKV